MSLNELKMDIKFQQEKCTVKRLETNIKQEISCWTYQTLRRLTKQIHIRRWSWNRTIHAHACDRCYKNSLLMDVHSSATWTTARVEVVYSWLLTAAQPEPQAQVKVALSLKPYQSFESVKKDTQLLFWTVVGENSCFTYFNGGHGSSDIIRASLKNKSRTKISILTQKVSSHKTARFPKNIAKFTKYNVSTWKKNMSGY